MPNESSLIRYGGPASPPIPAQYHEVFEQEEDGFSVDLADLRAMIFRQRYWILGSILVALLLGLGITMLMTPIYRSTATVQIEPNVAIVEEGQDATGPEVNTQNMQQALQAQVEVLKSRNLAARVADQLKLQGNDHFLSAMNIFADADSGPAALRDQVIGALQSNLVVDLPIGSQTAKVNFDSPDPALSAAIANAYAQNLITSNLDRRFQASSYARQFLTNQIQQAKQRLEASERAALEYARSAQVIETGSPQPKSEDGKGGGGPSTTSLSAASLIQMNTDLATARTARIQAEQRWRAVASAPLMSVPEVLESSSIQGLQADRARLTSQLEKLRQTYEDTYPDIAKLKSEIAGIDREIEALASEVRNSVRERYRVAARQESAIAGRMGGLKANTLNEQSLRIRYDILSHEASANRELYDGLLQRFREVSTAAGAVNSNISILDNAVPPTAPIKPRLLVNIALAFLAGLGIGLLLAFVRERMNDTIRSPDDILDKLRLPLLGTTPLSKVDVIDEIDSSRSSISEAYHSIRSSIEFSGQAPPRSLLVTSVRSGEGKSTTAFALAKKFAALGGRVLLVDVDLRIPSLHKTLGVSNETGLVNVITGRMKLADAVKRLNGIDFLPSGPIPPNPTEILSRHAVHRFLTGTVPDYEIIVMDGPPVMGLADAPQIASVAEATVLMVEAGKASRGHAKTAIRRLEAANANLIGVILTKFDARSSGLHDDYGYYYEYGSKPEKGRPAFPQFEPAE